MSGTVHRILPRVQEEAHAGPGILFKISFQFSLGKREGAGEFANKTTKKVETRWSTPQSWQFSFG